MTQEDKAKRYDEALHKAKRIINVCVDDNTECRSMIACIQELFPELKEESEGERIRKALIKYYSFDKDGGSYALDNITPKQILAWLEKQGESDETKAKMFLINKGYPIDTNGTFPIYEEMYDIIKEGLEKQGEQKPEGKTAQEAAKEKKVDNQNCIKSYAQEHIGDKVEPKFKIEEGKWYVCTSQYCNCIEGRNYKASLDGRIIDDYGTEYDMHDDAYRWFRPWTIQDANPGDVLEFGDHGRLVVGIVSYVNKTTGKVDVNCLLENNDFKVGNYYNLDTIKPHPATKEQRNILFQKMKEAGYEWDAKKKELKEIEQKPVIEMKTPEESLGIDSDTYNKIVDECIYGEQKPADVEEVNFFDDFRKTDSEVEPKFHEGDWTVSNLDGKARQISEVHFDKYNSYYVVNGQSVNSEEYDRLHHLWTIENAKDGDVLVTRKKKHPFIFKKYDEDTDYVYAYCGICDLVKDNSFYTDDDQLWTCYSVAGDVYPATKEQRDTLMKAMADSGYTFDFEKRELKKIEQKSVDKVEPKFRIGDFVKNTNYHGEPIYEIVYIDKECYICEYRGKENMGDKTVMHFAFDNPYLRLVEQNPAWSEKDDEIIEEIINDIECARAINYHAPKEGYEFRENWLESIKERVQPQSRQEWSEEDERIIKRIDSLLYSINENDFEDIHTWFESLKYRVQPKQEWSEEDERTYKSVLYAFEHNYPLNNEQQKFVKSFKDRYTWKPSEEQIRVLDLAIRCGINRGTTEETTLVSLFNDLKKLI